MSHLVSYDNQKIHRNTFKEQLQAGKFVNSFTLSIAHSLEILHLARHAGIQAISLNLEHRKASVETATDVCIMGLALGLSTIIVVPSNCSDWITRLLDNGAQGIIVPRVGTAEMARTMVKYSKHRPLGERPLSFTPQLNFEITNFQAALRAQNDTTMTIPMIETAEGVDNCEEIAAVPGVDMIFIGVHDLSDDLGVAGDFDAPKLQDGIRKICKAATANNIYVGLGGIERRLDIVIALRKEFPCISYTMAGKDSASLLKGMRDALATMKVLDE